MKILSAFLLFAAATSASAQTTYELTTSGMEFIPDEITMQAGDSIHLVLGTTHSCTEVSQATWEADGNVSNGGFNYFPGEYTFSLETPGTYYYVCIPHVTMGMKGKFIVTANTVAVQELAAEQALPVFPNPASDHITLAGMDAGLPVNVVGMDGKCELEAVTPADGGLDVRMLPPGTYAVLVKDASPHVGMLQARMVIVR